MKKVTYFFLFLTFLYVGNIQAQLFTRTAEIKEPSKKERGFGAVVAGVDFDKDGRPEIYAINTNMVDGAYELIPRIYKFELNPNTAKWDSVWSATAPITAQNTWPALAWGDTDKDGKPELYWGIVNALVGGIYIDAARILVYEYPGDKSDNMGVADGLGGFMPNAMTNIMPGVGNNIRPTRFIIADPDKDGKDEIIFNDRSPAATNLTSMHMGVISVDVIPDLGGGKEKWTVEFNGASIPEIKANNAQKFDIAVLDNYIYAFDGSGFISSVKFEGGVWKFGRLQKTLNTIGSFKGTQVVDIDKDGKKEILMADWFTNTKGAGAKVWLLQQAGDSLKASELIDFEPMGAVRLNGSSFGDLDNDGKLDFVFGARDDVNNSRKVPIFRLEYQTGDITKAASYTGAVIDSAYWTDRGDMDVIVVANVDGDKDDEVLYTQGYSRGNATDKPMPLIVLDTKYTKVSVEKITSNIPTEFYVEQNYPNPFNPSTQIRFGITVASNVDLKIYDVLGREVATLINKEFMNAGVYNVKFNAIDLASGIYIYKLTTGNHSVSKKMQLMK